MVYAYEDPKSFGAAMHNRLLSNLEKDGHKVTVSDLYASGFHAVAAKWDFVVSGGAHEDYLMEQGRAARSETGFAEDIKAEIMKLRNADLVIFEFPLWWSAPSSMMKGWFDKVFAMGVVWDGNHRYDKGLLRGKQALVVSGVGDDLSLYNPEGPHGATIEQHLYPLLHSTLAHAGFDVLQPFFATSLTRIGDDERSSIIVDLEMHLAKTLNDPTFIYKHA